MNEETLHGLALCAGVGGLELGLELVFPDHAYRTVCYVEIEAYSASALVARMEEGVLAQAPVWDDLLTFDGHTWRRKVDLVSAGFPCQPWSAAGSGEGVEDERWIWPDIVRVLSEVEPDLVFLENVPPLVSRGGLAVVLGNLAELGFDAEWDLFSAADVGASHRRDRLFILAYRDGTRFRSLWRDRLYRARVSWPEFDGCSGADMADADGRRRHARHGLPRSARRQSVAGGRGGTLGDTIEARLSGREGNTEPRGVSSLTGAGAAVGDARCAERRPRAGRGDDSSEGVQTGRQEMSGGSQSTNESMGDASDGGRGERRQSSEQAGQPHGADETLEDAARDREHGRERTHSGGWWGVSQTGDGVADADGGALRVESERDQRRGRDERAAECEHTESRADVPLFPPGPGDADAWRAVLAIRV